MKKISLFIISFGLMVAPLLALPSSASAQARSYVALGDSVASGAGLPKSASASDQDIRCDRSPYAYPYSVARSTGMSLNHVACAGAKADEGIYDRQEIGTVIVPEQLDRAFANGTPDVMSITIGANDVRWRQFITACLSTLDCNTTLYSAAFRTALLDLRINELNWIMYRIKHHSNGTPPTVLLNGYYSPLSDNTCSDTKNLTAGERRWIERGVTQLNKRLQYTASKYSYVTYVDAHLGGNGLCSNESYVQGLQDAAPLHPTIAGQEIIAQANITALQKTEPQQKPQELSKRERFFNYIQRYRN